MGWYRLNQETRYRRILELTQQMGALAKVGAWEGLHELAEERQQLLEPFFETESKSEQTGRLVDAILEANRQLAGIAEAARQRTVAELDGYRRKKRAGQAYSHHAERGPIR